jgi:choline kinase
MGGRTPKTLIPVGDHEPLLHYILAGLRVAGVQDLLVVTGWRPGDVVDYVSERWDEAKLTFVRNARYSSWGNFHSLRLAIDQSPGYRILAVNSDIVVAPEVFSRVVATAGDLVLAVQRRDDLEQEDMRVQIQGDRVVAIGKGLRMDHSHGEFTGVSMLSPRTAGAYAELSSALEWGGGTSVYYEDLYARILGSLYARWAPVEADEYAEVDEPPNLDDAAKVIEGHGDAWDHSRSTSSQGD